MVYNQFDSYPAGLGYRLLLELLNANFDEWAKLLEKIKEISDDIKPTPQEIEKLKKYTYSREDEDDKDWYDLLYFTQGSFYHVLHCGYLCNVANIKMCDDYNQILDLDNKGFRGKGDDLEVVIPLERNEIIKDAKEWIGGDVNENFDPKKFLLTRKNLERCC